MIDSTQKTNCRLCAGEAVYEFELMVLQKYPVKYFKCRKCRSLQTEAPYWLEEAYAKDAEIYDTGKASRVLECFLALPGLLKSTEAGKNGLCIDFGGGTGLLARLMRDVGFQFYSYDKYGSSEFIAAYRLRQLDCRAELVTLFEVAEHFSHPAVNWEEIFAIDPDWVIGSTSIYRDYGAEWPYLNPQFGQHIFFYSIDAIKWLAEKFGRYAFFFEEYFLISRMPFDDVVIANLAKLLEHREEEQRSTFDFWRANPYRFAAQDHIEVSNRLAKKKSENLAGLTQPASFNTPVIVAETQLLERINSIPFWYHRISLPGGIVTPGIAPITQELYGIPADLSGKRVLDVGAWDGYWSFEALRRGAREVVAIDDFSDSIGGGIAADRRPKWETFDLCREALGWSESRCKRLETSVYDVTPERLGMFDVVFFFGTLYHLRHPLLALDLLAEVCTGEIFVESAICDDFSPYQATEPASGNGHDGKIVMEFYPDAQYADNPTNWWTPTLDCLAGMVRSAGFTNIETNKVVDPQHVAHCRGVVRASKKRKGV